MFILMDFKALYNLKDFNTEVICTHNFVIFKTCQCNVVQQPVQCLHMDVKLFAAGSVLFLVIPTHTRDSTFTVNNIFSQTPRTKIRCYPCCFLLSQPSGFFVSMPNQLNLGKTRHKIKISSPKSNLPYCMQSLNGNITRLLITRDHSVSLRT